MANILEAFVKLWADDSQLRASFQGLAPMAHLAGTTVGDRFAAGVRKAAEQAHENFRKEFIGPLQTEASGTGIGRGMQARPQDQYRAADLAFHKNMGVVVRQSTQALGENAHAQRGMGQAARQAGGHVGGALHNLREGLLVSRHLSSALLSELSPALGAVVSGALSAARSSVRMGVGFGAAVGVGIGLAVALGKLVENAKEAAEMQTKLSTAFQRGDAAGALAVLSQLSEKQESLATSADILTDSVRRSSVPFADFVAKALAAFNILSTTPEELAKKFDTARRSAGLLFDVFTGPKKELQTRQALLTAQAGSIDLDAKEVRSVSEIADAEARRVQNLEAQFAVQKRQIELAARQEAQPFFADGLFAQSDKIIADGAAKVQAARVATENQIKASVQATRAAIVAFEEQQMAHAVALGRVSMQAANDFQRAAITDPRRTLQEQQSAETKLFQGRRAEAQALLTFQSQITGTSGFKEQLEVQLRFLREISKAGGEGSGAWFDQVSKVFDVYKGIREQAQGILSGMVSIVAAEVSRAAAEQQRADARKTSDADEASHVEKMTRSREADALTRRKADQADSEIELRPTRKKMTARERSDEVDAARTRIRERREAAQAKEEEVAREEAARRRQKMEAEAAAKQREEAGKVSLRDFPSILRDARQRDADALRGDRVPVGDISAAVGRVDFWKTVDKEKLSPDVAVARLMEDPSAKLARALEGLTGGAGEVTPVLTGLGQAAMMATQALLALAGTKPPPDDGGSQPGPNAVPRYPGGPPLSEENRKAIMGAISTQLIDENLAVYGRR